MIGLQKWQVNKTNPYNFDHANNPLGRQGWLWSRLPITSINFVIEVEFRVGPGMVFNRHFRSPATRSPVHQTTYMVTVWQFG